MARIDRRNKLREFQERLAARLAQAKSAPVAASRLGFQIGDERWLIDLSEAGEIVPAQDIVPVPHTYAWYLGLVNVRGNLISAVDLAQFGGKVPTRIERESRVVLFGRGLEFNAGVLVTRMLGLHSMKGWTAEPEASSHAWQGACWRDDQGQVWRELSFDALASDERFLRISPL